MLTPDIAVVGSTVYVSYVDQATETVWLLISTESGVPGSWKKIEVTAPKAPVANTTVAASKEIICVAWQQLGDVGPEVWQRCGSTQVEDFRWLNNPIRFSIEGASGGSIDSGRYSLSGNLDNVVQSLGQGQSLNYIIWSENFAGLKVMRSLDGIGWVECANLPDQSGFDVRMPTIYVDSANVIWVATAQLTTYSSDIMMWHSTNGCTAWNRPVNVTMNPGFSDGPGVARLGDNLYIVNDDSTTAQPNPGRGSSNADINLSVCDLQGTQPANCTGTRAVYKNAEFPQIIAADGSLHLVSGQWQAGQAGITGTYGLVVYCVSQDRGQTWRGDPIPDSDPNTVWIKNPDFGYIVSRNRIAVDQQQNVYIVWATSRKGKSRIMLSTRSTLPTGTPSAVCAP